MTFKAKLSGLGDVREMLRELPASTSKRAVRDAMVEAGDVFVNAAVAKVPVDEGRLRDSIIKTWRIVKDYEADTKKPGKEGARAFVGPNYSRTSASTRGYAPHAHLVEWGTGPRYTKTGKYTGIADAQPYMRPAFDTQKEVYIRIVSAAILSRIDKALTRFRRKKARV